MDSISQAVLGAAVGEASLGRQWGYKAAVWGAVVATVPDLDVVVNPFLDEVARIGWHRGYSHSLAFVAAASFGFGWLFKRFSRLDITYRQWTLYSFWCLFTAVMLDCFTVYGTQLFMPFSRYQVGFNNVSIIDPIVTIPLLIGVVWALFLNRRRRLRQIVNGTALAIGGTVPCIVITPAIKGFVNDLFLDSLDKQGIEYSRHMSTPTIANTILWRMTAESGDGYWVGYYSLFDEEARIEPHFVPRNEELLRPYLETDAVQELLWFSGGWYTVNEVADTVLMSDLRFGEFGVGAPDDGRYIFTFAVLRDSVTGRMIPVQRRQAVDNPGKVLDQLIERIQGIE